MPHLSLYIFCSQAIKNASHTLTMCNWRTRQQPTGFMAVWQKYQMPNLKPLQAAIPATKQETLSARDDVIMLFSKSIAFFFFLYNV